MGNGKRQNALLVEIIITVLFFALSATVILEVFSTAYLQTVYADACNMAVAEAQNVAARIYVSESPEEMLGSEGFFAEGDVWQRDGDGYVLQVELSNTSMEAGEMRRAQITALRGEEELVSIPCAHYFPGEVAQ